MLSLIHIYSMEYRLVPDCKIFDQFRDVFSAMNFVKEHAVEDGGDLSHVYMVGDSGGACLITYTNAIQNNRKIAQAAGVRPSDLKVNALGLISGMFYTAKFDKIGMFLPKYLYGKNYKKTSFCKYVNPEKMCIRDRSESRCRICQFHAQAVFKYQTDDVAIKFIIKIIMPIYI